MQTTVQSTRFSFVQQTRSGNIRRSVAVCRAQMGFNSKDMERNFALAAAAISIALTPASDALAAAKQSAYQKELSYQEELINSIKARNGRSEVLPDLKSSPKDAVKVESKAAPALKFEGIEKVKTEAPASVPTPSAAVPAVTAAPKASAPASSPAAAPAAGESDNKGVLAVAAIAIVGAAGLAAANGGQEGAVAAPGTPAVATAGAGSDAPSNVKEAREWIAAWKKKHGKA